MSILKNEGHDPNGFGNAPSRSEVERLRAVNADMLAALRSAEWLLEDIDPTAATLKAIRAAIAKATGAA